MFSGGFGYSHIEYSHSRNKHLIKNALFFIYTGKSLLGFPEDRLTSHSGTKTADLARDKLRVVEACYIHTRSAGFISTSCIRIVLHYVER